jgi:hypothetical protein
VVRWQGAANATGYELRMVLTDGRRILGDLAPGSRNYRVGQLDPATGGTVSVRPLSDAAGNGPASQVRLRPPAGVLAVRVPRSARRRHGLRFTVTPARRGTLNVELFNARGDIVRFARIHARAGIARQIGISLKGTTVGRYALLLAYSLDGSFKPFTQLRQVQLR